MLTLCKGIHTGDDKAVVPWRRMAESIGLWINGWEDTVIVKDPSDMTASQLTALYQYLIGKGLHQGGKLDWTTSESRDGKQGVISKDMESKDKVNGIDPIGINLEEPNDGEESNGDWGDEEDIEGGRMNDRKRKQIQKRDTKKKSQRKQGKSTKASAAKSPKTRYVYLHNPEHSISHYWHSKESKHVEHVQSDPKSNSV
jgi:hypothetical protein